MAAKEKKGLGMGLDALFAANQYEDEPEAELLIVPIEKVEPNRSQPRKVFEEEALEEAEMVLGLLEGKELELPVVFDPERIPDDAARTDTGFQQVLLEHVEEQVGFAAPSHAGNDFHHAVVLARDQLVQVHIPFDSHEFLCFRNIP